MFTFSSIAADAVINTLLVPDRVISALPLLLERMSVRVRPVVPLNVPCPTSHSEPLTIRYWTYLVPPRGLGVASFSDPRQQRGGLRV